MNESSNDIGVNLKQKIQLLVVAYERARQEMDRLRKDTARLEELLADQKKAYKELEERYSRLKVAKALTGSETDKHEAKIMVNRLVREIDRCIALLNK